MTPADIPAGLALCRAARWNQIEADWRRYLALNPAGARVAVDSADTVIGSVTTLRYDDGFDWLAMVLVSPDHRRQGIASTLVEEAIELLGARAPVRLDATPAGELVYRKLGFKPEYELARMERLPDPSATPAEVASSGRPDEVVRSDSPAEVSSKPLGPARLLGSEGGLPPSFAALDSATADPAAEHAAAMWPRRAAVRVMDDEALVQVLALDREVFGADRAALLRMLREDAAGYAVVDPSGAGYALGRHGFSFDQLGPIVARDERVARRLVRHLVASHPGVAFLIDAPRQSDSWIAWLGEMGFREQRGFVRLVRGGAPGSCDARLFATIGADFG
jgi:GNAT superfamily N-acetyltransferase